jgi:cytochrome c551/c552
MCNWRDLLRLVASACLLPALVAMHGVATATERFPGIGRAATPSEVTAWDIDVRPDFKGLPAGSGSVATGQDVWESKCASCHGVFGESNQVFTPIVGGTTADDVRTGRVARLTDAAYPGRTSLMKLATVSTLWDYINRAMPWNQPKSLSVDEVYAVTAFVLHLGDVVPASFTLSNQNIAQVQARLPNRLGMTTAHALWPDASLGGTAKPDVRARACMRDCQPAPVVASSLPDFARNQHGNLAEQSRLVGAQRGADTSRAETRQVLASVAAVAPGVAPAGVAQAVAVKPAPTADGEAKAARALAAKFACTACHGMAQRIVGPSFAEIAKKHSGKTDYLAGKIRSGGSGVWGPIPMPSQTLSESDARTIAIWLAAGAAN